MMKKLATLFIFSFFSVFNAQKKDSLQFVLPAEYSLYLAENQKTPQMEMLEYIPKGQNWDNYNLIVTKLTIKNAADSFTGFFG
ncbi:hypothetical protein [Chryseobacterium sp. CT-SW4]|uniref:hypothetical protein n=1 Tax=Chryseobacterium sp. SW-1 TaxID=3157343 RepID=UPI003B02B7EE